MPEGYEAIFYGYDPEVMDKSDVVELLNLDQTYEKGISIHNLNITYYYKNVKESNLLKMEWTIRGITFHSRKN